MKELLTTSEVAEIAGITSTRVRQLIIAGILPAEKFGRDNLVKRADLDKIKGRKNGRPKKENIKE